MKKKIGLFLDAKPPVSILRMREKDRQGGRMLPYLSMLDPGDQAKGVSPDYVFGCNFSIRRSVLLEPGGFHPDAVPPEFIRYRGDGETHVARYILEHGYKAIYHPKASIYHIISSDRMTEKYFILRAFSQGISDSYTEFRTKKPRSFLKYYPFHLTRRLLMTLATIRRDKIKVGYYRGYSYHQDQVMNDLTLYDWVTRKSYLE